MDRGMELLEDREQIALVVQGDRTAFENIYQKYSGPLYGYVRGRLPGREDAEEMVQELFVQLWLKRDSLRDVRSLRAYLFGAARNAVLNYYRAADVRKKYAAQLTLYVASLENPIEDGINLKALQENLELKIKELPERCQEAFRLSRFEYLPIQTVAERMNISVETVKNYLTLALKHLRMNLR